MKLKNLIQLMGIRGRPKHYPYELTEYDINKVGIVRYPQWKHPSESKKVMTTAIVDRYRKYISEGDFCIDIGAHSGDTTLPMALAAGISGCVLALEPNHFVYPVLEKVARANSQVANIRTIMAAAGPAEGFMEFEYSGSGFCNGGRHENISSLKHGHAFKLTVFAVNLENELRCDFLDLLPRLRLIKIDTEGYDLHVLRSIEQLIREYRPIIKSEMFKKTDQQYRHEMLEFFEKLNYIVYKVREEPFEKGEQLSRENLGVGSHYDILALPKNAVKQKS